MSSLFRISTVTIYRILSSSVGSKTIFLRKKSINSTAAAVLLSVAGNNITYSPIGFPSTLQSDERQINSSIRRYGCDRPMNLSHSQQCRKFSSIQNQSKIMHNNDFNLATFKAQRLLSTKHISKNLTLYTNESLKIDIDPKDLKIQNPTGNPLVVMMSWLMAKQKHLRKYVEIYTNLGYDVLIVYVTAWQLMWPTKGTQLVALETLKFLENNNTYSTIVVHGFSAGAYQFGEMMLIMEKDNNRYQSLLERIASQVWDSAADITEMPIGVSKSLFPRNPTMQNALLNYTHYHMKTFHNQATIHYIRASEMFHSTILKVPALLLVSKNDLMGPEKASRAVKENWEKLNIKVTLKCWDQSEHVAHYIRHKSEYLSLLYKHLEDSGAIEREDLKSMLKL